MNSINTIAPGAYLPGRDSHPLDYTTLPGRTQHISTIPSPKLQLPLINFCVIVG
jgi:hypothetical protein